MGDKIFLKIFWGVAAISSPVSGGKNKGNTGLPVKKNKPHLYDLFSQRKQKYKEIASPVSVLRCIFKTVL